MKFRSVSILVGTMACFVFPACSSDDDPASCGFEAGIYDVTSFNFHGDTGICIDAAQVANTSSSNRGGTTSITKVDDATFEANGLGATDAPTTFKLDGSTCTLRASITDTVDSKDSAGKPIKMTRATTTTLTPTGAETFFVNLVRDISTSTSGATGIPCTLTATASGTRRR